MRKQISVSFKPPSLWYFVNSGPEKLAQMNIAMWHSVLRSEMCFEKQTVILPETRIVLYAICYLEVSFSVCLNFEHYEMSLCSTHLCLILLADF